MDPSLHSWQDQSPSSEDPEPSNEEPDPSNEDPDPSNVSSGYSSWAVAQLSNSQTETVINSKSLVEDISVLWMFLKTDVADAEIPALCSMTLETSQYDHPTTQIWETSECTQIVSTYEGWAEL